MTTAEEYAQWAEQSLDLGDKETAQVYATLAVAASLAPEKRTVARDYYGKVIDPTCFIPGDVP